MGNSTCFAPVANATSPPLFQNGVLTFQAHWVGWIVSGFFASVAVIASFWLINKHLIWYTNKRQQRQIVRLLFLVPIYAVVSLLSYIFWTHAIAITIFRDCYEAVVLGAFFYLLLLYLADTPMEQKEIFRHVTVEKWMFPLGFVKWRPSDGLFFLQLMKWGVLQYCVVRPVSTAASIITNWIGLYCEQSWSPGWSHIWLVGAISISVSIAMYCLLQLYFSVSDKLAPHKPLLKLFAVKAVVFLTFWQGTFLSVLSFAGVIKDTKYMTADDINNGIAAILETFEMMLFAFVHIKAFTYLPYRDPDQDPKKQTSRWRSLCHAFNFGDLFREMRDGTVYMWRKMRGHEPEEWMRRRIYLENALGKRRDINNGDEDKRRDRLEQLRYLHDTGAGEPLDDDVDVELERRGLARKAFDDYEHDDEMDMGPRKQSSWWRNMYARVSTSGPDSYDPYAALENSRQRSKARSRSRSRSHSRSQSGNRSRWHKREPPTLEDAPPPSIIFKNPMRGSAYAPVRFEPDSPPLAPRSGFPASSSGSGSAPGARPSGGPASRERRSKQRQRDPPPQPVSFAVAPGHHGPPYNKDHDEEIPPRPHTLIPPLPAPSSSNQPMMEEVHHDRVVSPVSVTRSDSLFGRLFTFGRSKDRSGDETALSHSHEGETGTGTDELSRAMSLVSSPPLRPQAVVPRSLVVQTAPVVLADGTVLAVHDQEQGVEGGCDHTDGAQQEVISEIGEPEPQPSGNQSTGVGQDNHLPPPLPPPKEHSGHPDESTAMPDGPSPPNSPSPVPVASPQEMSLAHHPPPGLTPPTSPLGPSSSGDSPKDPFGPAASTRPSKPPPARPRPKIVLPAPLSPARFPGAPVVSTSTPPGDYSAGMPSFQTVASALQPLASPPPQPWTQSPTSSPPRVKGQGISRPQDGPHRGTPPHLPPGHIDNPAFALPVMREQATAQKVSRPRTSMSPRGRGGDQALPPLIDPRFEPPIVEYALREPPPISLMGSPPRDTHRHAHTPPRQAVSQPPATVSPASPIPVSPITREEIMFDSPIMPQVTGMSSPGARETPSRMLRLPRDDVPAESKRPTPPRTTSGPVLAMAIGKSATSPVDGIGPRHPNLQRTERGKQLPPAPVDHASVDQGAASPLQSVPGDFYGALDGYTPRLPPPSRSSRRVSAPVESLRFQPAQNGYYPASPPFPPQFAQLPGETSPFPPVHVSPKPHANAKQLHKSRRVSAPPVDSLLLAHGMVGSHARDVHAAPGRNSRSRTQPPGLGQGAMVTPPRPELYPEMPSDQAAFSSRQRDHRPPRTVDDLRDRQPARVISPQGPPIGASQNTSPPPLPPGYQLGFKSPISPTPIRPSSLSASSADHLTNLMTETTNQWSSRAFPQPSKPVLGPPPGAAPPLVPYIPRVLRKTQTGANSGARDDDSRNVSRPWT